MTRSNYQLSREQRARVYQEMAWARTGAWRGHVTPWHGRNRYRLAGLDSRGAVSERDVEAFFQQWEDCKEEPLPLAPDHCFDQLILSDPGTGAVGDCWRTCLGCLLASPPELVPHFVELELLGDLEENTLTRAWLQERGLQLRESSELGRRRSGLVIASGASPRVGNHAVVWDPVSGCLHFDPHPSRSGLLGAPERFYEVTVD